MTNRNPLESAFLIFLTVAFLAASWVLLAPFFVPVFIALMIAVSTYPIYAHVTRKLPKRSNNFRAFLGVLGIFLIVLTPVSLIVWGAISEAETMKPVLEEWDRAVDAIKEGDASMGVLRPVRSTITRTTGISPHRVQRWIAKNASRVIKAVAAIGAKMAGGVVGALVGLFFLFFSLFFFYRDGPALFGRLQELIPLRPAYQEKIFDRFHLSAVAILRGWLLTALAQGTAATIGFLLVGVTPAVLLGVLAGVVSILPVGGTSLVWAPVGIAL
jgi:predicted PurR-regulated permease PerM